MSKENSVAKKTVKIKEAHLVDLIDNIVNEAVAVKKQEWINEQAVRQAQKSAMLENKIAALTEKVNRLTEGKK
jgi:hypothetical protein